MDSRIRKDPKFSWLTDVFQLCKEIYAKFNWGELTKMFVVFFVCTLIPILSSWDFTNTIKMSVFRQKLPAPGRGL